MIDFVVDTASDEPVVQDSIPLTADVEYPCTICGREAGPYGGRGRKPTKCADCKPARNARSAAKVTGADASLAAKATEVLSQVNGFMTLGIMSLRMFRTAGAIAEYDETFRAQAYAALVTDPELCKFILRGGVKSAKLTLALAYGGMIVSVSGTAKDEFKEVQAQRKARKESEGGE